MLVFKANKCHTYLFRFRVGARVGEIPFFFPKGETLMIAIVTKLL